MVQQSEPWRADGMNEAADRLDWAAKDKEKPAGNFDDDYNALCRLFDVPAHPCLLRRQHPTDQENATATTTTKSSLNLRNFEVDKTTVRLMVEALTRSSDIDALHFHNAGLTEGSIATLAEHLPKTGIRSLSLDYNTSPSSTPPLIPREAPTRADHTEAAEEEAGDNAVSTSAASSSSRNFADFVRDGSKVKALSLRGNGIGDDEVVGLAKVVEGNTVLCSLNLFDNAITDVGAAAFAESLKLNSTLRGLSLARNRLNAASAEAFGFLLAGGYEVPPSELDKRLAAETKIAALNKTAQDAMKKKKDAKVETRLLLGTLTKTEDGSRTISGGSQSLATINLGDNREMGAGGAILALLLRLAESRKLNGGGGGSAGGVIALQELHLRRCQGHKEQEEEGEQGALVAAAILGLRPTKVFV